MSGGSISMSCSGPDLSSNDQYDICIPLSSFLVVSCFFGVFIIFLPKPSLRGFRVIYDEALVIMKRKTVREERCPRSGYIYEIPLENQIQNQNFKIAILEGPSGHLWHVILCYTNARASFKDGWENFVSFHSIQAQDTLVFRHVIDTYFSVQIFGSNGSEKQSTFTVDKCRSHCLKEETPFPNCKERKSDDEKTAKSFLCISISSDAEKDTNKDTNVDILTTSLNESSSCNIAKIGVTPSKRKKVHTVKAAHAETNMFSGRPVSSNNHVPLNASKTNTKDTVELNKLNLDALRNLVGWTAEMPIILDAEEEVNAQCSHGHKHDRVKVKACEILQEESSLCSTAFARTKKYADTEKQRKFKLATKKRDQCLGQNYSFDTSLTMCVDDLENFMSSKTNKPKFSVVMRKTAVSKCYWLCKQLKYDLFLSNCLSRLTSQGYENLISKVYIGSSSRHLSKFNIMLF
eukprot:Gb_04200 [translate_table: standard]